VLALEAEAEAAGAEEVAREALMRAAMPEPEPKRQPSLSR
jgi:hypothetical protein